MCSSLQNGYRTAASGRARARTRTLQRERKQTNARLIVEQCIAHQARTVGMSSAAIASAKSITASTGFDSANTDWIAQPESRRPFRWSG